MSRRARPPCSKTSHDDCVGPLQRLVGDLEPRSHACSTGMSPVSPGWTTLKVAKTEGFEPPRIALARIRHLKTRGFVRDVASERRCQKPNMLAETEGFEPSIRG